MTKTDLGDRLLEAVTKGDYVEPVIKEVLMRGLARGVPAKIALQEVLTPGGQPRWNDSLQDMFKELRDRKRGRVEPPRR